MPKDIGVNWPVIQVEFSHGVSIPELARKYGISEGTIKARSARHKWMETRPLAVQQQVAKGQGSEATGLQHALAQGARNVGMDLASRGQAYAARMFEKASKLAESAEIKQIRSVKDLEVVDKIARRSAGLDTAEVTVNTLVAVGGMDDTPVFHADSAEVVTLPADVVEEK